MKLPIKKNASPLAANNAYSAQVLLWRILGKQYLANSTKYTFL